MAAAATDELVYLVRLPAESRGFVYRFRKYEKLKMAVDHEGYLWVSGLSEEMLSSAALLTIPEIKRYYRKEGQLYPVGNLLPEMAEPTLLWTPIRRALSLQLPEYNHHFFGVNNALNVQLKPATSMQPVVASLVSVADLEGFVQTAPKVRLEAVKWLLWGQADALVIGHPLLPIKGKDFWQKGNLLLPAGLDFASIALGDLVGDYFSRSNDWHIWFDEQTYYSIPKDSFMPLTRAGFRETIQSY